MNVSEAPSVSNRSYNGVIFLGCAMGIIALAAVVRLGLVVSATPQRDWLSELPLLLSSPSPVEPATSERAETLQRFLRDAELVPARMARCRAEEATAQSSADCVAVITDGLDAKPASGELWLGRAVWLLQDGSDLPAVFQALSTSYKVARLEAWVASGRVTLGLRLYPLLPPELQQAVQEDLALVLDNNASGPLVDAYVNDPAMREAAAPALEKLPPSSLGEFLDLVRRKAQAM